MSDISSLGSLTSSYMETIAENNANANRATSTTEGLNNLSSSATKEELEEAAKSFEGYFVEQVIKKMKESVDNINGDEESSVASKYKDYFMDSTITTLAEDIVDKYGENFTETMVEQMGRNYGINLTEEE